MGISIERCTLSDDKSRGVADMNPEKYLEKISEFTFIKDLDLIKETEAFIHRDNGKGYVTAISPVYSSLNRIDSLILSIFVLGLIVCLYGVFVHGWYINELSAVFLMIALLCGIVAGMNATKLSENVLNSIAFGAPGAFMVGYAASIKVLMEMGGISDTISHNLAEALQGLPTYFSGVGMAITQSITNFFIPSGSGQALATLPIMIPLGEVLGLTRQVTILAFQIGDGLSNLVNPTLGGLIAMLGMCRVPLDRWLKFIFPLTIILFIIAAIALVIAVAIGYQ